MQEYPQKVGSVVFCFGKTSKSLEKTPSCSSGKDKPCINTKEWVSHLISAPSSTWFVMQFWGVKTGMNSTKKTQTYNQSSIQEQSWHQRSGLSASMARCCCSSSLQKLLFSHYENWSTKQLSKLQFIYGLGLSPFRKFLLMKEKLFSKSEVRSLTDLPVAQSRG